MMRKLIAAASLAFTCAAGPLAAQTTPDSATVPHLFTRRDLYYAGGFAAAAAVFTPLDRLLAERLQDSTLQTRGVLRHGSTGVRLLGSPGSILIAGSVYTVGRLTGSRRASHIGLHTAEAIALAEGITRVTKSVAGRARPAVDVDDPYNFALGRGFGDAEHQSFPSGHTSAAFAAASAGAAELSESFPQHRTLARVALYGGATLVGLSRMYNNRHWASDVIGGAAIGSFSGWKVVSYTHAHPDNPLDRIFLPTAVVPRPGGGLAVAWMLTTR